MAGPYPYGRDLDPNHTDREQKAVYVEPGYTEINITPSTVDQGDTLEVNLKDLNVSSVIRSDSLGVSFNIELTGGSTSPDANRTIVNNLGRAIVKRIVVKMAGFVLYDLNEADTYYCCKDLWQMTALQRSNASEWGIHDRPNVAKIKVGAGDADTTNADDVALARQDEAEGGKNRFVIPLVFDLFTDHLILGKNGISDPISFEITFNTYANVILSSNSGASYKITNLKLRHKIAVERSLSDRLHEKYRELNVYPYTYVHHYRKLQLDKSSTQWDIEITQATLSLRGILMVFEDVSAGKTGPSFGRNPEYFPNPGITNVLITINGTPNSIYPQGYNSTQQWPEALKGLVPQKIRDLGLQSVTKTAFSTSKFAWWLDMRASGDERLHGNGRKLEGTSSIVLQMTRARTSTGTLNCYIYLEKDAVLKIANNQYVSAVY
jgi:hypothetical protein